MAGPCWPIPCMASGCERWARIELWESPAQRRANGISKGSFQGSCGFLFQLFLHLWTTAMKTRNREQTQAENRILAQLESGATALQKTSGQHRRACGRPEVALEEATAAAD